MNKLKHLLSVYRNDGTDPRKNYPLTDEVMQEVSLKVAEERGLLKEEQKEEQ